MSGFHEVRFPENISFGSSGGPLRLTEVTSLRSGYERRNCVWENSKRRYDVGSGLKSIDDIYTLIAFFEARMGRLYGFRYLDYSDYKSCTPSASVTYTDQILGTGDGIKRSFALCKKYLSGDYSWVRTIEKPVSGSVVVALGEQEQTSGWSVDETTGTISFDTPPASGIAVSAGFQFDVPVRFDTDELTINLDSFKTGSIPSVKLTEVRL